MENKSKLNAYHCKALEFRQNLDPERPELLPTELLKILFEDLTLDAKFCVSTTCRWWRAGLFEHFYEEFKNQPALCISTHRNQHTNIDLTASFFPLSPHDFNPKTTLYIEFNRSIPHFQLSQYFLSLTHLTINQVSITANDVHRILSCHRQITNLCLLPCGDRLGSVDDWHLIFSSISCLQRLQHLSILISFSQRVVHENKSLDFNHLWKIMHQIRRFYIGFACKPDCFPIEIDNLFKTICALNPNYLLDWGIAFSHDNPSIFRPIMASLTGVYGRPRLEAPIYSKLTRFSAVGKFMLPELLRKYPHHSIVNIKFLELSIRNDQFDHEIVYHLKRLSTLHTLVLRKDTYFQNRVSFRGLLDYINRLENDSTDSSNIDKLECLRLTSVQILCNFCGTSMPDRLLNHLFPNAIEQHQSALNAT